VALFFERRFRHFRCTSQASLRAPERVPRIHFRISIREAARASVGVPLASGASPVLPDLSSTHITTGWRGSSRPSIIGNSDPGSPPPQMVRERSEGPPMMIPLPIPHRRC
jgi:hypothetical protein